MPRPKGEKKTRLNLEITETLRARIERLVRSTEADSMVEVIRRAVIHYEESLVSGKPMRDTPSASGMDAKRIAAFLAKAAEEKDDPVLAAAAEWVERGDWKAEGAKDA